MCALLVLLKGLIVIILEQEVEPELEASLEEQVEPTWGQPQDGSKKRPQPQGGEIKAMKSDDAAVR
jgi:hypothetical protein